MIVAALITVFVLWLLLAPRGRVRLGEASRERPGHLAWMGLGAVLVMVTVWGMVVPWIGAWNVPTPLGPSEIWRVTGVLVFVWVGISWWRGAL